MPSRFALVLLLASSLLGFCASARAEHSVTGTQALKAAYLYNFALYVEWPEPASGRFGICVVGKDLLGGALDALTGKRLRGTPVAVRRLGGGRDFSGCHLLYLGGADPEQHRQILGEISRLPLLTVGDANPAKTPSPMILLRPAGERLVFEINLTAARAAGLKISSKMLQLARKVY